MWILCFPAAIICFIWVKWWVGLIVLLIGFIMPSAIKRSASEFTLEQALEDEHFYDICVKSNVLRISERR